LAEIVARAKAGRRYETLLPAGQTAGGIEEILPVATIMRQFIAEAEAALSAAAAWSAKGEMSGARR
jgi:hypothetical protein